MVLWKIQLNPIFVAEIQCFLLKNFIQASWNFRLFMTAHDESCLFSNWVIQLNLYQLHVVAVYSQWIGNGEQPHQSHHRVFWGYMIEYVICILHYMPWHAMTTQLLPDPAKLGGSGRTVLHLPFLKGHRNSRELIRRLGRGTIPVFFLVSQYLFMLCSWSYKGAS